MISPPFTVKKKSKLYNRARNQGDLTRSGARNVGEFTKCRMTDWNEFKQFLISIYLNVEDEGQVLLKHKISMPTPEPNETFKQFVGKIDC